MSYNLKKVFQKFLAGAIRYAVHVVQELDGKFSSWEVLASSSNIRLSDLAAGAWYNLSVSSVGIRNRRNTEKSQPLRVQTGRIAFHFKLYAYRLQRKK